MNKSILTFALTCLAVTGLTGVAFAHNDEDEQPNEPVYRQDGQRADYQNYDRDNKEYDRDRREDGHRQFDHQGGGDRVGDELQHLNGMLQHVEREIRTYRADRHARSEFQHIRAEAYDLNNRFRRGEQYYDRRRVLGQIRHMHDELHHIEEELRVPAGGFFQWR